jgi:uncharacterized protein YfiM (DUF2279 family)
VNAAGLVVCFCLSFSAPTAQADRWLGEDKFQHFLSSFVATTFSASAARFAGLEPRRSMWAGVGFGTAVGVAKEIRDLQSPHGVASVQDLAWDLAGVGTGAVLMARVR